MREADLLEVEVRVAVGVGGGLMVREYVSVPEVDTVAVRLGVRLELVGVTEKEKDAKLFDLVSVSESLWVAVADPVGVGVGGGVTVSELVSV